MQVLTDRARSTVKASLPSQANTIPFNKASVKVETGPWVPFRDDELNVYWQLSQLDRCIYEFATAGVGSLVCMSNLHVVSVYVCARGTIWLKRGSLLPDFAQEGLPVTPNRHLSPRSVSQSPVDPVTGWEE